jgi:hypothetical protein
VCDAFFRYTTLTGWYFYFCCVLLCLTVALIADANRAVGFNDGMGGLSMCEDSGATVSLT